MDKIYTDDLITSIYNFYISSRYSLRELQNLLKIDRKTLQLRFKKLKLSSKKNTTRKYFFNESYFENIDTEQKAYWLGFIYADGNIHKPKNRPNPTQFELSLKPGDVNHIKQFVKEINHDVAIITTSSYRSRFCVGSFTFCNHLIDKGCVPKKSLILKFPTFLSEDLIRHFIRGYFDGDGYINDPLKFHIGLSLIGTEEFLKTVLVLFNQQFKTDICKVIRPKSSTKCFQFTLNGKNAEMFLKWIYENNSVSLKRKEYRQIIHFARRSRNIPLVRGKIGETLQLLQSSNLDNTERAALEYLTSKM